MSVRVRSRLRRPPIASRNLAVLAQRVLAAAGAGRAELSLELIGDGRMQRLNRQYRGQDRPTDVLAFAMREGGGPPSPLLGDLVISLPTAMRQARQAGHSVNRELTMLLIHGVLHLLGYDHERGETEARRMRRREQAVLRQVRSVPVPGKRLNS